MSAYYKITYFLTPESADRLQLVMFWTGGAKLRASSSFASPNSFFIGAHRQELSGARNTTLTCAFSFLGTNCTTQGLNLTHLAYPPLWVVLDLELIRQTTYFYLAKVREISKCLSKFELNLLRFCHVTEWASNPSFPMERALSSRAPTRVWYPIYYFNLSMLYIYSIIW